MTQPAVTIEGVSKIYRVWSKEEAPDSLSRLAGDFLKSPIKNYRKYRSLYKFDDVLRAPAGEAPEEREDVLWALRDLSLEIMPGEVVGIVGVNGAGKTTLLKILSRITPPTTGTVRIRGRVSSLLEVGTGFHPELTGRENVYLNGTILGMRKREVDAKFDQIVDFAGVDRFLDTPVKRYSSGMRVRLAFAVAAHLEPEVLIIDEVLAVGDANFQQKCLNKMEQVGQQGRTVLFVSHNMPAVTRLCQRGVLLNQGRMVMDGPASDVVSHYLTSGLGTSALRVWEPLEHAPGDSGVRLRAVSAVNAQGEPQESCDIREPVGLRMEFDVLEEGRILIPQFTLSDENAVQVFVGVDRTENVQDEPRARGRYSVTAWIPGNLLSERTYYVTASIRTPNRKYRPFQERDTIAFHVVDSMEGDSVRGSWAGRMAGVVRPALDWETDFSSRESKPPRYSHG
jgi:lipopolysaccharide transport system ATP-binding protein